MRIQPDGFTASTNADGQAHSLLVQYTVPWFFLRGSFWATVGRAANARFREEVAVLEGEVAGKDSGTSSSRGGKTTKTVPIRGSGL